MKYQTNYVCEICGALRRFHTEAEKEKCSKARKQLHQSSKSKKSTPKEWNEKFTNYMAKTK